VVYALIKENIWIINIIHYHNSAAVHIIAQSVTVKLKNVDFRLISARNLYSLGNFTIVFFESVYCTGIDSEHPDFW